LEGFAATSFRNLNTREELEAAIGNRGGSSF
jgi:hypothetical protein